MTTHPGERSGSVYLLHFEPGLPVTGNRVAVTTSASPSATSRDAWRSTCDGRDRPWSRPSSRRAARVTLERVWADVDRGFERRLKRRHETPRLCPRCARDGLTGGRGPLSPAA
jgi:hypothetical protein